MKKNLTCPSCGFSKYVDPETAPSWAEAVICPKCPTRFPLRPDKPDKTPDSVSEGHTENLSQKSEGRTIQPESAGPEKSPRRLALDLIRAPYGVFTSLEYYREITPGGMFSFGLITGSLGTMMALFWYFVSMSRVLSPEASGLFTIGLVAAFAVCVALVPLWVVFAMAANSLLVHACLLLVGAGRQGFGATFNVVACSQSAKILCAVPVIGVPAALLWQFTIQVIGLREIHGISSLRLLLAVTVPACLISLLVVTASSAG